MKTRKITLIIALVFISLGLMAQDRTIKVLAIGNSFSWDAVEQNLHQIAAADGTTMVIGNMYIGGCPIHAHVENFKADKPAYRYVKISADGTKKVTKEFRLSQAIRDEEWDYVTVQQASHFSGQPETYKLLPELVAWIAQNAPQAEIVFHQTWAYAPTSTHGGFKNYDRDQQKMYNAIVGTVREECAKCGITRFIPSGVTIQTAREMSGDPDFTRDGFHMSYGKGRYAVACTWYEALSGRSVVGNKYIPDGSEEGTEAVSRKDAKLVQKAAHAACTSNILANPYVPTEENLAARKAFSGDRFGIFIHWGIYSMMADGEWVLQTQHLNHQEYAHQAACFCPSAFDANEWVKAIKASGAKYVTITSRHHDGFSMFDTKASDYNIVKASPFGRDVIGEMAKACADQDIRLHLYYSHLDWGRDDYWPRGRTGLYTGRQDGKDGDWDSYRHFMETQLTELLTNYGPIGAIWFDGVWDKDMYPRNAQPAIWHLREQYDLIHSLQPGCLVGNNHHLLPFAGEDIQIFERDVPGCNEAGLSGQEISSLPLETCQTMNGSWGYCISDRKYKSVDELVRYLVKTAGKGANLLLNIGPRQDGTIPEEAVERLKGMGEWLAVYGESIYGTEAGLTGEQPWGVSTQKGDTLYLHVLEQTASIELPATAGKLLSAEKLGDGSAVEFTQTKTGITVTVPEMSGPDTVIALRFKNLL